MLAFITIENSNLIQHQFVNMEQEFNVSSYKSFNKKQVACNESVCG